MAFSCTHIIMCSAQIFTLVSPSFFLPNFHSLLPNSPFYVLLSFFKKKSRFDKLEKLRDIPLPESDTVCLAQQSKLHFHSFSCKCQGFIIHSRIQLCVSATYSLISFLLIDTQAGSWAWLLCSNKIKAQVSLWCTGLVYHIHAYVCGGGERELIGAMRTCSLPTIVEVHHIGVLLWMFWGASVLFLQLQHQFAWLRASLYPY